MTKKRGRPKGKETTQKNARVKNNLLEQALRYNNNYSECCNQGLAYFNMISSGEYEIKKK